MNMSDQKRRHEWFPFMNVCRRCGRTLEQEINEITECSGKIIEKTKAAS